jgi:hypothetical protein
MTNLEISNNLYFLINLFNKLQKKPPGKMPHQFNISFFDGIERKTMPVGWNELKDSVDFLENQLKFERKPKIQEKYDIFMDNMKKEGKDMYGHIMNCEMNLDIPDRFAIGKANQFILSKNRFPYDFGNHKHYVLWIHPDCDKKLKSKFFTKDGCENEINKMIKLNPDTLSNRFIVFRNAAKNKSVGSIEHFHVVFY